LSSPLSLRKPTLQPIQLGFETIHPQQQRVGKRALDKLLANEKAATENKRSPLILLQPQGGKTGVIAWIISLFIEDCIARGRTFQIIVLCGLSEVVLASQTKDRLLESTQPSDGATGVGAQLDVKASTSRLLRLPKLPGDLHRERIPILHNSVKLRQYDLNIPVDVRLWIGDECHIGNVKIGNIDTLLRNHGVKQNEQIHTWDNSKTINHLVGVSATPSAHMAMSDNIDLQGPSLFTWIYETPPPNYNSFKTMRAKDRLKQTDPLFLADGTPTDFLKRVHTDFLKVCEADGPGHLVVRATGKKHAQLMGYINRRGRKVECREFDSMSQNIDGLTTYLSTKPAEPTIVIIRGSMRAGITLDHKHHIRGWVETESATSDTVAQSGAGRACGYNRTGDTYPIYCDLRHVDSWIEAYDTLDSESRSVPIPSGRQNHGMRSRNRYPVLGIMGHKAAWDKYVLPDRNAGRRGHGSETTDGRSRYRAQLASTDQLVLDIAGMFLEGRRDSGSTKGIHVNGTVSKEAVEEFLKRRPHVSRKTVLGWVRRNRASFQKLIEKFPEVDVPLDADGKGKVIIFDAAIKTIDSSQTRSELQKSRSALKREAPHGK